MAGKKNASPRGTKNVVGAFMGALAELPDDSRHEVGKAAVAQIREKLTAEREKAKAARAKARSKTAGGGAAKKSASRPRKAPVRARVQRDVAVNDTASIAG